VADETVEGVRNAEDGWRRGWDLVVTTLLVDVAKREGNPKEGALGREVPGQVRNGRTLKRREAYERMKPVSQDTGGRHRVGTVSPVRNGEGKTGVGNPIRPTSPVHTTL
jgi:hypothetical protein